MGTADDWVRWFEELGTGDVAVAGGKNASLGEMIRALEPAVVQARPETVQSRRSAGGLRTWSLREKGQVLVTGLAIGDAVAAGAVRVIPDVADSDRFRDGEAIESLTAGYRERGEYFVDRLAWAVATIAAT